MNAEDKQRLEEIAARYGKETWVTKTEVEWLIAKVRELDAQMETRNYIDRSSERMALTIAALTKTRTT